MNHRTVQELCALMHEKFSKVIFLMETKANSVRLENVKNLMHFYGCFSVDAIGRKGGLALL